MKALRDSEENLRRILRRISVEFWEVSDMYLRHIPRRILEFIKIVSNENSSSVSL